MQKPKIMLAINSIYIIAKLLAGVVTPSTLFQKDHITTSISYRNLWHCDERMEWFRRWLRDNMDMMIRPQFG